MIYVPNQKGSPTLANFRSSVKYVISNYIKEKNKDVDEKNKIAYALVNIVGIPSAKTMDDLLKNVDKINKLTLRFYPLNGDLDFSEVFGVITRDMREEVGSKNGEIVFKSPKSINGVKTVIEKAAGTIDPILQVTTKGKSKATLKDYELSEKYELEFNDNSDLEDESSQIINKMSTIDTLNFSNDSHQEIYERNKVKIIPFVKKYRVMNIKNFEKVMSNAEKLTEKSNSNKVFLQSLKILKPNKSNFLHKLIFGIIEVTVAFIMAKRTDTIGLTENVLQVVITVMLAFLAVVFTGYAFFQALINDKLLVSMIATGDNKNNKLSEANIYFAEVMIFQIGCMLLDLLVIVFMIVLPEDWTLLSNNMLNEAFATIGISFLLYCNVESIWEMKSFIFNVFQLFNLHAYSRIAKIQENQSDKEEN